MEDNFNLKALGVLIGGVIVVYILIMVWPFLVAFLALVGAWHLYQQYKKPNH